VSVPRTYADALFLAAGQDAERVAEELDAAVKLFAQEPDLLAFLEHPGVGPDTKKALLREILENRVCRVTFNFLQVLVDKRRSGELRAIAHAYRERVEEALGQGRARVQSARVLEPEETRAIAEGLERRTGKRIRVTTEVRPELIGGVRVILGDKVLDASVRGQLERLAEWLSARN
jgi:F-type H+-transporting ATPase subunit delta